MMFLVSLGSLDAGPLGMVVEGEAIFNVRLERRPTIKGGFEGDDAPVALQTIALGDDGASAIAAEGVDFAL